MRGEHGPVGEVRLLLREQPVQAEQQRPALAPCDRRDLRARLQLGERGVERAAARGARRELDRRVLVLEHERLAGERRGALDRVVGRNGRRGLDGH
jgi:hypothetical protein